jgi:hypothetical protein
MLGIRADSADFFTLQRRHDFNHLKSRARRTGGPAV